MGGAGPEMKETNAMKRLVLSALLAFIAISASANVPFIEDDYTKAVSQAKKLNVPIFVEAWAPW